MPRARLPLLAALTLYAAHAAVRAPFQFVDAAENIAHADNLAAGLGLVAWPGAPWVEAFSSPLWVLLLAPLSALGLPTAAAAQVLGALLGAAGLVLAWNLARRIGASPLQAAVAPLILALSPVYVCWAVSGTEDALLGVLLLAALTRLSIEHEQPDRRPLSGLLLGGLALTGVSGTLYAGVLLGGFALATRRITARLALMLAPLLAWQVVRIVGFGDPLSVPMHHLSLSPTPFGWRYLQGLGPVLPALAVAGGTMALPAGLLRRLLLAAAITGVGFAAAQGGDWATPQRLLLPVVVASAPLAAGAISALAAQSRVVAAAALVLVAAPEIHHSLSLPRAPEMTTADARLRVEHIRQHAASIGVTGISIADPDAAIYWLDTDWPVVDIRQLRTPEDAAQQVLVEVKPAYVHLHGGWASRTKLTADPRFQEAYVEIDPYVMPGGREHVGTYVRRELLEPILVR